MSELSDTPSEAVEVEAGAGFADRAERVLILAMIAGILALALSPRILWAYQAALGLLIVSTLLQIAVGNVPKAFGTGRGLARVALILGVVAIVFVVGILLVPVLSTLGR